jgi:hypothetical protein
MFYLTVPIKEWGAGRPNTTASKSFFYFKHYKDFILYIVFINVKMSPVVCLLFFACYFNIYTFFSFYIVCHLSLLSSVSLTLFLFCDSPTVSLYNPGLP